MTIAITDLDRLNNIGICALEEAVNVDPTMLYHLGKTILEKAPEVKEVAFIQSTVTPKGEGYAYLELLKEKIRERYLFNPTTFANHKKKKQADSLWHADKIPTFSEIKHQAKIYRLSEKR